MVAPALRRVAALLALPAALQSLVARAREVTDDNLDYLAESSREAEELDIAESTELDEVEAGEALAEEAETQDRRSDADGLRQEASTRAQVRRVSASISSIMAELAASVPRASERIAVDSLVRKVRDVEQLSPESDMILRNISVLFDDIFDDMRAARDEDQAELELSIERINACTAPYNQSEALRTSVLAAEEDHVNCRDQEDALFQEESALCGTLVEFLTHLSTPNCEKPLAQQSAIPAWDTFLAQGESWFDSALHGFTGFIQQRDDCTLATASLQDKVVQCNQLQNTFEGRFCEWHLITEMVCDTLITCYNNSVESHEELVEDIVPIANQRVREAGLIVHMQCLIANLLSGVMDQSLCEPILLDPLQPIYNQSYPPIPAMAECNATIVSIYPGHPDWYLTTYGDLSVNTPAQEDAIGGC